VSAKAATQMSRAKQIPGPKAKPAEGR